MAEKLVPDCWRVVSTFLPAKDLLALHLSCKHLNMELQSEVEKRFALHCQRIGEMRAFVQRLTRGVRRGEEPSLTIARAMRDVKRDV